MKEGWEIKTLGDIYDVRDGTHDSPKYVNEGFALITSKNLKNNSLNYTNVNYINEQDYVNINKRSKVDVGDVLFAMIGTIGNPIVIKDEPDFAIKNVALFKVPQSQDSYFLKYFLDSDRVTDRMQKEAKGTTQKFVGLGYLRNFEIPLPPLPEQQRIVSIIDEAFEAIDKAIENTQKNLQNAKELLESYLNEVFEKGGEDWEEKLVKDVALVIAGQSPEGKYYNTVKVGLPFYQGKKEFGEKYIKPSGVWTSVVTKTAIAGDILMSVRAPVGPVNVSVEEICIGRGLAAIRQKDNVIHDFLFYFFKYYEGNIKGNIGAVFDSINRSQIENIPFLIPSIKEQKQIVAKITNLEDEVRTLYDNCQQKLRDLEELKKSVLNKAFAGEL